jgi:ankyrin repeat protein
MRHGHALVVTCMLSAALGCTTSAGLQLTPLASAARVGATTEIAALVAAGHDVNGVDPAGNHWTPLLHAIHKGQFRAVDALIAAGADVNRAAPGGFTPLLMAVGNGRADIVRRLLAAGADPGRDGPELLATAVSGGALTDIDNPLLGRCNTEVVQTLLHRAPDLRLEPNLRSRLALSFARLNDCADVLRLVCRTGCTG